MYYLKAIKESAIDAHTRAKDIENLEKLIIHNILKIFVHHNIVLENIIHKRNKVYRFEPYLKLLEKVY